MGGLASSNGSTCPSLGSENTQSCIPTSLHACEEVEICMGVFRCEGCYKNMITYNLVSPHWISYNPVHFVIVLHYACS